MAHCRGCCGHYQGPSLSKTCTTMPCPGIALPPEVENLQREVRRLNIKVQKLREREGKPSPKVERVVAAARKVVWYSYDEDDDDVQCDVQALRDALAALDKETS